MYPVNGQQNISADVRQKIIIGNCVPRRQRKTGHAEIVPFPAVKQRGLCDRELVSVMNWDDDAADQWLTSVVRRHQRRLEKLGVAPNRIAADVADLESAFGLASD
jgi:hypothetical protein